MRYVALIVAMLCVVVVAMGFAADSKGGLDPNGDYRIQLWRPTGRTDVIEFNAVDSHGYSVLHTRGLVPHNISASTLLKGSEIEMYDNRLEIRTDGRLFVYNGVYWIFPVKAESP